MGRWHRPYPNPLRALSGLVVLCGSLVLGFVFLGVAVGHTVPTGPGIAVLAFAAAWLVMALRVHRTALLVSDTGIRVSWLTSTRTYAWEAVSGFRFGPDILGTERLWIDLAGGRSVRAPIQRVRKVLGGSLLIDGGTWLEHDRCAVLLSFLEHESRVRQMEIRHGRKAEPDHDRPGTDQGPTED